MNMLRIRAQQGFSATETMVAVLVGAAITIPTLGLLFQSRDAEQRSRFEYLALLAARDEMYQSRVLVALGRKTTEVAHAPKVLAGNSLDALTPVFAGPPPIIDYHDDQSRVATGVEFDDTINQAKRLRVGTITSRWMDPTAASGAANRARRTQMEIVFGVVLPPKP